MLKNGGTFSGILMYESTVPHTLTYCVSGDVSDCGEEVLLAHDGLVAGEVQELRENPRLARKSCRKEKCDFGKADSLLNITCGSRGGENASRIVTEILVCGNIFQRASDGKTRLS